MPLDPRKALHMQQMIERSFAGRQRMVVLVTQASGSYSYTLISGMMRMQSSSDPQIFDATGRSLPQKIDAIFIAPLATSFVGAVYLADTTTASGSAIAAAAKYQLVEVRLLGMAQGGSRQLVLLRRWR